MQRLVFFRENSGRLLFYRDCSDPYHIFLSDAHSCGKTFWLTQWNRHSVFAGAIGNFIDRVTQRYVVDFFYFRLINFPVFNVADIYVTVAAVLLILCLLFYKEEDFERILPTKRNHDFVYH